MSALVESPVKSSDEIHTERQRRQMVPVEDRLLHIAALWPKKGENVGTLVRTADALGASVVVPPTPAGRFGVRTGNTLGEKHIPVWWVPDPLAWLRVEAARSRIVAVELAHGAIKLNALRPITGRTVLVLGHEIWGVDAEAAPLIDEWVEIPMFGVGNSLNVSVAGSLVAYKLAGLS